MFRRPEVAVERNDRSSLEEALASRGLLDEDDEESGGGMAYELPSETGGDARADDVCSRGERFADASEGATPHEAGNCSSSLFSSESSD